MAGSERPLESEIYVAASRGERGLARAVQKALKGAGLRAWDAMGEVGEGLPLRAIETGLSGTSRLVLVVTDDTPAAFIDAELQAAARASALPGREPISVVALTRGASAARLLPAGLPALSLPGDRPLQQADLRDLVTRLRADDLLSATTLVARRISCPYPGLRAFEARDAAWFFGRGEETAEALARMGDVGGFRRWLEIEGGPGVGKSSLARAGVVPAFLRGAVPAAPADWMVATCRPGRHPIGHLALALTRAFGGVLWYGEVLEALQSEGGLVDLVRENVPADRGLLLLVDGLDDAVDAIAGAGDDPEGYTRLDRRLAEALTDFDRRLFLVTTVRNDVRTQVHAALPRLSALQATIGARYALGAMNGAMLAEAIAGPARLVDHAWSEPLSERILLDATEAGASLPAVAHVLRALWTQAGGAPPSVEAYAQLGGVAGAIDAAAEKALRALDPEVLDRARRLLVALVRPGRGFADRARSLASDEAVTAAGGGPRGQNVVNRLVGDPATSDAFALLALDRGEGPEEGGPTEPPPGAAAEEPVEWVRLAHDALLGHWSTLRQWIAAERPALERRDDIERAARAWMAAGSPPAELPAGRLLAHFEGHDLHAAQQSDLPSLLGAPARRFVEAARTAEDRRSEAGRNERSAAEAAERARAARESGRRASALLRTRAAVAALAVAAALLLAWAINLVGERSELMATLDVANHLNWRRQAQLSRIEQQRHETEKSLLDARQLVRATERQRRAADREGVLAEMNADEVLGIVGRISDSADDLFGRVAGEGGRFARRAFANGVLAELERALSGAPDNELLRAALARQRQRVAEISIDGREIGTALAQYEKAIPVLESLAAGESASVSHLRNLADAYHWLGDFRARDRKNPQWQDRRVALDWFEKERAVLARLEALEPDVDEHPRRLADLHVRMSAVRLESRDVAGARTELARAVEVQRALAGRKPGDPEPARRVAALIEQQGDLEAAVRGWSAARAFYDGALKQAAALGADEEGRRIERRVARKLKGLP